MKTSTQLKALIRNLSSKLNVEAEVLLRNFIMERFLERISISKSKNNFVLKGGMLIASIVGIDNRNTMDMDVTIINKPVTESEIISLIEDIINTEVDDYVEFTYRGIEEIREDSEYNGYRVSINAFFDKTARQLKLIFPQEISLHRKKLSTITS